MSTKTSLRIQQTSPPVLDEIVNKYVDKVVFNLAPGATFHGMSDAVCKKIPSLLCHNTSDVKQFSRYGDVLGTPQLRKLWANVIVKGYHTPDGTQLRQFHDAVLQDIDHLLPHHELMITAGANQGFVNVILAICDSGDDVLLILPYYFSHYNALLMTGVKPVCVPVSEDSFLPDVRDIEERISPKTRALVVVNPGNPSGIVFDKQLMRSITKLCKSKSIWLIIDEAYREFVFEEQLPMTYSPLDDTGIIHLFTASKVYGMAGWRVGALLYPKILSDDIRKAQDTIPTHATKFSEKVVLETIRYNPLYEKEGSPNIISMTNQVRLIFTEALKPIYQAAQLLHNFVIPNGAFYFFLPYAPPDKRMTMSERDDMAVIDRLALKSRVLVAPGFAFGMAGYVRVSYGCLAPADAREAARMLAVGMEDVLL